MAADPPPQDLSSDIPLTSPLRTHSKRLLPPSLHLSSTYPHGHISGHPRSPTCAAAFQSRKATILSTMTPNEIEARYREIARKVEEVVNDAESRRAEVERECERLRKQRDVERRVFRKLLEGKGKKGDFGGDGAGSEDGDGDADEEDAEGRVAGKDEEGEKQLGKIEDDS
ncbi:hypothetical protein MMC09_003119 [Bachmanniomyces sp. S44760]|nr:hypothetical protein [Bachmanniomyces sp. S44760]